jgi:heavy metal translocating P-type ATPase
VPFVNLAHDGLVFLGVAGATVVGLALTSAGAEPAARAVWAGTTAAVLAGVVFDALGKLRRGRIGVDVVALLALVGSLLMSEFLAGAIIAVMVASGGALERFAHRRARRDLSGLLSAAPRYAHRVVGGELEMIAAGDVAVGDLLVVRPGEVVPVDGMVVDEPVTVDESVLTGEALPVGRIPGEFVRSGSLNAGGPIRMRAAATADDSAYAGIVRLVEAAGAERAPFVRLADRYAVWFVPVTLVVAGLAWWRGGATDALAVLLVATPCPLILAAPIAIVSGIAQAARHGVVVKDGAALEGLAAASAVLFDKTGTLTTGRLRVTGVVTGAGYSPDEVLQLAASLEQASPHVLAAAVVREAHSRALPLVQPEHSVERPGWGVSGEVGGRAVRVGARDHVVTEGCPPWVQRVARRARRDGVSLVFVALDGTPAGALLLADEIRTDTSRAVRALRRAGVERLVMVTGDRRAVAEPIGSALGLDGVYADRSPAEKVDVVRGEHPVAGTLVMVGDGVNDAPALAAADIGVAMGARGATVSSDAADVVLVVDRLDRLATGIRLARRARGIARQSVLLGMGLAFVAMALAAFGHLPPVAGALLQEGIDIAAIANALRVLRRPSWDDQRPIPESWARQLNGEHADLRLDLDEFRAVADRLDTLEPFAVKTQLAGIVAKLRGDVLPHERVDESEIYPAVARRLGGDDPLAAMSRTHRELFHLTSMLERLVEDLDGGDVAPGDVIEARRLLYALDAILRLHFAQEEELYAALATEGVST